MHTLLWNSYSPVSNGNKCLSVAKDKMRHFLSLTVKWSTTWLKNRLKDSVSLLGTGSFELRADGSIHEWTMENQSPAGSAKLNYVALDLAVFGVRVQSGTSSMAKLLRTHPPKGYPGEKRVCKVHSILTTLISLWLFSFACSVLWNTRPLSLQRKVEFNGKFIGNVTNLKLKQHKTIVSVFHRFGKFLVIFFQEKACKLPYFKGFMEGISLLISIILLKRRWYKICQSLSRKSHSCI